MPAYVQSPLTIAQFEAVWQSVVDPGFGQGFSNAGEGNGYEAYTQGMAQLARVSSAISTTMGAMYILPWSGQVAPPASGAQQATVQLTFSRTLRLQEPLVLGAGTVWYDEVEPEPAVGQGTTVNTGRRFTLQQDLVFLPGQSGPLTASAIAERPGYGYNNPQPGSINLVEQPGTQYANSGATLSVVNPTFSKSALQTITLASANQAEVFLPQHVGQYVTLSSVSTPTAYRVTSYVAPASGNGGSVNVENDLSFSGTTFSGTFAAGEILTVASGGTPVAYLTMRAAQQVGSSMVVVGILRVANVSSAIVAGYTVTGQSSGATFTIAVPLGDPTPAVSYAPGASSWRILDWVLDFGLSVTNAAQPSGGTSPMLDELGYERKLPRNSGEPDSVYRQRVAVPADTVSPNAVKRMLNRTLTKGDGLSWCFREVGTPLLPGFFYDHDAFDYDAIVVVGTVTGTFVDGERAWQTLSNGQVAQGHALVSSAVPSTPFVPGQAGTTGIPGPSVFYGVANINPQPGGAFVAGLPIVGKNSGASSAATGVGSNPMTFAAGLDAGPTTNRVFLDYLRFRAYFRVEVQPSDFGEFGFFWGGAASGVGGGFDYWDDAPFLTFYDGWAETAATAYLNAYHAVDAIRAAGVFFEVGLMTGPCV